MDNWLFSALLALVLFGLWGFFPKLAITHINPLSALIYQVIGGLLVGLPLFLALGGRPQFHAQGSLFALLTGICGVLGTLFYYAAARKGSISITVGLTALYPVITILLAAVFLKEPLTIRQVAGIGMALGAIFLLTG